VATLLASAQILPHNNALVQRSCAALHFPGRGVCHFAPFADDLDFVASRRRGTRPRPPSVAVNLQLLGTIFLRLIKVIIAPLLFGVLVVGIAGHSDLKKVGRLGLKSLIYFEIVSTIAMLIGYAAITSAAPVKASPASVRGGQSLNVRRTRQRNSSPIFFREHCESIAEGQVLQIVVSAFSLPWRSFSSGSKPAHPRVCRKPLGNHVQVHEPGDVCRAARRFRRGCLSVATMGLGVLLPLLKLLATMYIGLLFFSLHFAAVAVARIPSNVLSTLWPNLSPLDCNGEFRATLPRAIEQLESFGYRAKSWPSFCRRATASTWTARVSISRWHYFLCAGRGLHPSIGQQVLMILTLLISSKGTAGVARASLLIVFGAATSFHLPMEPLFLLFRDRSAHGYGRTAVTVLGNWRRLRGDWRDGKANFLQSWKLQLGRSRSNELGGFDKMEVAKFVCNSGGDGNRC